MAEPTIQNYFGSNAQMITDVTEISASTSDPVLVIRFSDFADEGFSDPENFDDPDKTLAAFIKKVKRFTDADTAEDSGVEVANPTKSFTTRKNASVIAIAYDVAFYIPDPTATSIDPDSVI